MSDEELEFEGAAGDSDGLSDGFFSCLDAVGEHAGSGDLECVAGLDRGLEDYLKGPGVDVWGDFGKKGCQGGSLSTWSSNFLRRLSM